jgi:DNA polymerase III gamma/tau subunit
LSEKVKKALPAAARIEVFDLPKTLFTFLESFIPGNAKTAIAFLEKTIETQPLELVFSVFSKHIRDLYWARVSPETLPYPSWRLQKLGRQARAFDQEQLASFLRQLAEIDISVKTESQSLLILLDLFVVKALESS